MIYLHILDGCLKVDIIPLSAQENEGVKLVILADMIGSVFAVVG
jgi:hypothetical protein